MTMLHGDPAMNTVASDRITRPRPHLLIPTCSPFRAARVEPTLPGIVHGTVQPRLSGIPWEALH